MELGRPVSFVIGSLDDCALELDVGLLRRGDDGTIVGEYVCAFDRWSRDKELQEIAPAAKLFVSFVIKTRSEIEC